jgi:hypothetical protein
MATYELYLGGPRQQNIDWAIFPAATFSSSNVAALGPANKTPVIFGAERTLDFTNDTALAYFYTHNLPGTPPTFSNNDFVGTQVIPANSLFLGCWYSINTPVTGGVFSLIVRGTSQVLVAGVSTTTATSAWVPYNGAGVITTLDTVTATWPKFFHYFATPDIIDTKFTTVPAGGIQALSLTVTPVYLNFQAGRV